MISNRRIGIILSSHPFIGGGYQYALCIVKALSSICDDSTRLFAFSANEKWEEVFGQNKWLNIFSFKVIPDNYFLAGSAIDSFNCDIVVSDAQNDWANRRLRTPVVAPLHDLMHRYESRFPEVGEREEFITREFYLHGMMEDAEAILVDSFLGKKHALESYGKYHEDSVYILPFTIPPYIENPYDAEEERIDIPFNKYFFYPAQFWKHKNHVNLLKAMSLLRSKGINVCMVFTGAPKNNYKEVMLTINNSQLENNVAVLGYVSNTNIKRLYTSARALIMPTFFGPTNIPPLEAMSLGCPVAVSDNYGMPDQLGDAALYFNPANIEEISNVMKELWEDDAMCERLRVNGFNQIKKYMPEKFNERLNDILDVVFHKIDERCNKVHRIIDFCKQHNAVYLFGAGKFGLFTKRFLDIFNIKARAFIVSNSQPWTEIDGLRVISLVKYNQIHDVNDGVICSLSQKLQKDVLPNLLKTVNRNNIYLINDIELISLYDYYSKKYLLDSII